MTASVPSLICRFDGVAFLEEDARGRPIKVLDDRRGRPCSPVGSCPVGPVRRVGYGPSPAAVAAAVYRLDRTPELERAARLDALDDEAGIFVQPVLGELVVVERLDVQASLADARGRGEEPWDTLEDLPGHVAVELSPHLPGIRDLRLRADALACMSLGDVFRYHPKQHVEEVLAAARGPQAPVR
jgi:hypothetical protein